MNLELLDPFRNKQIPDRIDSTLNLPVTFHFRKKIDIVKGKGSKKLAVKNEEWRSANHIAFNRRGSYIAVGYGSGTIAIYDVLSRTVSSIHRQEMVNLPASKESTMVDHGVTSLSWSRRSRTLLVGSLGSAEVRLIDTTHPFGPEECFRGIQLDEKNKDTDDDQRSQSPTAIDLQHKTSSSRNKSSFNEIIGRDHLRKNIRLRTKIIETQEGLSCPPITTTISDKNTRESFVPAERSTKRRYPSVLFSFPRGIGNSLQIHPRNPRAGQSILKDGSLIAFCVPQASFEETIPEIASNDKDTSNDNGDNNDHNKDAKMNGMGDEKHVRLATLFKGDEYEVFTSAFDPQGEKIYAATKDGKLLGFEVAAIFDLISNNDCEVIPPIQPTFVIQIPGNAWAWQIVVSRNGQYLIVNSTDATLRLYATKELWDTPNEVEKPIFVFQDVVSKVKFVSCDISGDNEYVVGGSQGTDSKYELYVWNTTTGALMDKLTGSNVELYSVAWHPTRSFLAVAAADGLVDVWGPRINWTAFAPDFQALPRNVEYLECEDEFDIVEDEDGAVLSLKEEDDAEDKIVDILTVEPVPVFQSDSEDEADVFTFRTKMTGGGKGDSMNRLQSIEK